MLSETVGTEGFFFPPPMAVTALGLHGSESRLVTGWCFGTEASALWTPNAYQVLLTWAFSNCFFTDLGRDKEVRQTKACVWCFWIQYCGKLKKVLAVGTGHAAQHKPGSDSPWSQAQWLSLYSSQGNAGFRAVLWLWRWVLEPPREWINRHDSGKYLWGWIFIRVD